MKFLSQTNKTSMLEVFTETLLKLPDSYTIASACTVVLVIEYLLL